MFNKINNITNLMNEHNRLLRLLMDSKVRAELENSEDSAAELAFVQAELSDTEEQIKLCAISV